MDIVSYRDAPDLLDALVSAYNRNVAGLPHCYPVRPQRLRDALSGAIGDPRLHRGLRDEEVLIAWDGGRLLGFVHLGIGSTGSRRPAQGGIIRFLVYQRGARAAGQALLDAAEAYLRGRKVSHVVAFHQRYRYSFYHLNSAYLSDRLGQVHALMGWNGYRRGAGEGYFDWPNMRPEQPVPSDAGAYLTLDQRAGAGQRPDLLVRAYRDGREIGHCRFRSSATYGEGGEAEDWAFCTGLGVNDAFQGRGLGRELLQRALIELRRLGYPNACISTAWDNHRAALFYTNVGFRVADWTYGLGKALDAEGAAQS